MAFETFHSSLNARTNSIGSDRTRKYALKEALTQSSQSSQPSQGIRKPTQKQGIPQSSSATFQIPGFTKTLTSRSQITSGGRESQTHLAGTHLAGSLLALTKLESSVQACRGTSTTRLELSVQAGRSTSTAIKLELHGLARSIMG